MTKYRPQVITTKDAKKQVNRFGSSLVIYIFINQMLWYGIGFLKSYYPQALLGFDPDLVIMVFFIVTLLIAGFGLFRISSKVLDLDIKDYLRKPEISAKRWITLICLCIGITYLSTAVATFFRFLLHPASGAYAFVGYFTTPLNIIKNAVYFLLFVLIKPLCDEYVFRGVIQRQLGHYNRYFGVIASAFLYALASPSLTDAIPAFFSGWFLALVTYRYHSIIPARRIHIATAFFAWLIAVIPDRFVIIPTILTALVYIIGAASLIGSKLNFHISSSGALNAKLWKTLLSSFTIILSMILFIAGCVLSFFIV